MVKVADGAGVELGTVVQTESRCRPGGKLYKQTAADSRQRLTDLQLYPVSFSVTTPLVCSHWGTTK